MAKAIHSMVRVEDRSADFYRQAFGLQIADRFEFEGFTLVYLRNGEADFELELTIKHSRSEPYALGDGYGHIALAVADLDAEHARLEGPGLRPSPIKEFNRDGALMARFFFIQDPDGYKIEVFRSRGATDKVPPAKPRNNQQRE